MKQTSSYFRAGRTTVGTSAVQAAPNLSDELKQGILLYALAGNGGTIDIGGPDVASGTGIPLTADKSIVLPLEDADGVYAVASAPGQILVWAVV